MRIDSVLFTSFLFDYMLYRYLIVIHDVTKEEVYNKICAFPWANRVGGRIIVTTDIQSAARPCICGNDPPLLAPDSITSLPGFGWRGGHWDVLQRDLLCTL